MKYNFDKVIDRSGTSAEKVEGLKHIWGRTDLIPLWESAIRQKKR